MAVQTMQKTLEKNLALLDFETESSASGLLFTNKIKDYKDDANVSFDEILILDRADKLGASAVYFRRIEGRSSIPQLFIFDNSDGSISQSDLIDIHTKLWSSGIVSLYYVFDNTEIRIFNCRKPVKKFGKNIKLDRPDTLSLIANVHANYKKYSARLFQNGSFWELERNKERFKADSSSSKKLMDGLRKTRNAFIQGQNETACNKLLVLSILVKYLEERKDSEGRHVLGQEYFSRFDGADSFCEVLRKKLSIKLFEDLSEDINGKIFKLDSQEKKEIGQLNQTLLADFLDANLDRNQYLFWRLYDFNYIPVELISRIYEEFITERKDIAYTPPHLVNFMIDECIPINSPKDNIKVIDVSCGSGIFLVSAFKRIVQLRQRKQYEKTGKIKPPTIATLKSILTKQIHGVDIESEAVRLAVFSLTIAFCDMLDPTTLWKDLNEQKLEDLSSNIITKDFFDYLQENKNMYDLVIGNPPFNLPIEEQKDKAKEKEEKDKYWNDLTKKVKIDFDIPDKNIALVFLQQAMKLLKKDGLLSLVIPSPPLLYNNTLGYRKAFFNKYNVPQIFDFSSLSDVLFESKNYPVTAIFAENATPNDNDILHVAVRRTRTAKEKLYFEIDKYDLYYVPKELATTEQLIWKANILGSGHLYHLLKRMQVLRKLGDYLKDNKIKHGWKFGEGYIVGDGDKTASYLTGKRSIPTSKFVDDVINKNDLKKEEATKFYRIAERNKEIFQRPHVLIKEKPSLPIAFVDDDLIFKNEIIGIHAPEGYEQLIELRQNIRANKKLYKMLLLSGSGRAGISRSITSILMKDIMPLPYPENEDELKLSKAEQIVCDDVLNYGIDQLSCGEEAKINIVEAKKRVLSAFAKTFCTSLNSIYKENGKQFYSLDPIYSLSFICQPFAYGNPEKPKKISRAKRTQIEKGDLTSLIDNQQGTSILYKRVIKLYHQKDMVYLIKPKTLRYWLKSIALRDANEVFTDLMNSGY